jgi:hypothetical protein
VGKSTVNYKNPTPWWQHWFSKPTTDWLGDYLLQGYERDQANKRHATYSFDRVWPKPNTHGRLRSLGDTTPYVPWVPEVEHCPQIREAFRDMFEKFWREL